MLRHNHFKNQEIQTKVNVSGSQQYIEKMSLAENKYVPKFIFVDVFAKPKYSKTNIVVFLSVSLISLFENIVFLPSNRCFVMSDRES